MEGNPMDKFTQDPVGVDEEKMLKAVEEAQRGMGLGVEESSRLFLGIQTFPVFRSAFIESV